MQLSLLMRINLLLYGRRLLNEFKKQKVAGMD
jgi:hypothetical protein